MKEIFFDLDNFEYSYNVYIKTTQIDDMKKREKLLNWERNVSEALSFLDIKDEKGGQDYEKKYLYFWSGKTPVKFNINTMDIEDSLDSVTNLLKKQGNSIFYDNNKNKYIVMEQRGNRVMDYKKSFCIIKDNIEKYIDATQDYADYFTVKEKNGEYFMKFNNEIYKFGYYYEVRIDCILEKEDGKKINKDLSTGFKTSTPGNVEFISFKDSIVKLKQNDKIRERVLSRSNPNLKLVDIKLYNRFENKFLIYQEKDNKYNVNIDNFNSLFTCKEKRILKEIYSTIYGAGIETGMYKLHGDKEKRYVNEIYKKTLGLTYIKSPIFKGYYMDKEFKNESLVYEEKNNNLIISTPYSYEFYVDGIDSVVLFNNKYFHYVRLNSGPGGRQIQYSTSYDFNNWKKFRYLKIDNNNMSNYRNYYLPNIFKYKDTNYLIGLVKLFDKELNYVSFDIIISRDGENFKTISSSLRIKSNDIHERDKDGYDSQKVFINSGLVEYKNNFKIYFWNYRHEPGPTRIENIYEYSCHIDELFYLTTDDYAEIRTKLIKVIDNKIILNYKCNTDGYIKIKLTDKFDNSLKDYTHLDCKNYGIKELSWNSSSNIDADYVKVHIAMFNSNIYSISGEFYKPNKYFNHIIYKVNDLSLSDGQLKDLSEKYLSINLFDKYKKSVVKIIDTIKYNMENTSAYITLLFSDDTEEQLELYNGENDYVECENLKFKRPICIIDYRLINIPLN